MEKTPYLYYSESSPAIEVFMFVTRVVSASLENPGEQRPASNQKQMVGSKSKANIEFFVLSRTAEKKKPASFVSSRKQNKFLFSIWSHLD